MGNFHSLVSISAVRESVTLRIQDHVTVPAPNKASKQSASVLVKSSVAKSLLMSPFLITGFSFRSNEIYIEQVILRTMW